MKILTLNTWQEREEWKKRWEVTFEGIRRFSPDIIGFQELFNRSWAEEVLKRTNLRHLLFKHETCGNVLLTRFDVEDWGVLSLSQSPLEDYGRYVLWACLKVRGKKLFVFNTHFSWMLEDQATRKRQTEDILKLIQDKADNHELLLMGDLNAPPDSGEIRSLIKKGGFRDLVHEKHPKDAGMTWDNRHPYVKMAGHVLPDRRIDYILARGNGPLLKELISCDRVFTQPNSEGFWASDHYGLVAEFKDYE